MRLRDICISTALLSIVITACAPVSQTGECIVETAISAEASSKAVGTSSKAAVKNTSRASSSTAASSTTASTVAFKAADETVYIKGSNVNLRSKPSTSSDKVGSLSSPTSLKRVGVSDEWSKVIYNEKEVYVASRFLSTEKPKEETKAVVADGTAIGLNPDWKYASFSKIKSGKATMYKASGDRKNKVICVNAGHGTSGGSSVKTQSHPDGTPKVTGGTTAAGQVMSTAVSGGMTFSDGTSEASVTLAMAKALKSELLSRGYDVLMIRESEDVQLDNIARTVIANNNADCHIALHWDSTTSNKGAFYMSVPDVSSYRAMEPVASNWKKHHALGDSVINGLKGVGTKIFSGGSMGMDLTQTSYSTIASIDLELGDKSSAHDESTLKNHAKGIVNGLDSLYGY